MRTQYRIAEADTEAITLGDDDVQPLTAITGDSRDSFVRERAVLLIGAALAVGGDRERQATLLQALLGDEGPPCTGGELI